MLPGCLGLFIVVLIGIKLSGRPQVHNFPSKCQKKAQWSPGSHIDSVNGFWHQPCVSASWETSHKKEGYHQEQRKHKIRDVTRNGKFVFSVAVSQHWNTASCVKDTQCFQSERTQDFCRAGSDGTQWSLLSWRLTLAAQTDAVSGTSFLSGINLLSIVTLPLKYLLLVNARRPTGTQPTFFLFHESAFRFHWVWVSYHSGRNEPSSDTSTWTQDVHLLLPHPSTVNSLAPCQPSPTAQEEEYEHSLLLSQKTVHREEQAAEAGTGHSVPHSEDIMTLYCLSLGCIHFRKGHLNSQITLKELHAPPIQDLEAKKECKVYV